MIAFLENNKNKNHTLGIIQLVSAYLLFSGTPVLVRFGQSFGEFNLVFFRTLVVSIALAFFFFTFTKSKIKPFKKEKKKMLMIGTTFALIDVVAFVAISNLLISSSILIIASSVTIFSILLASLILKEKIKYTTILALVLALLGMAVSFYPFAILSEKLIFLVFAMLAGLLVAFSNTISKTFKQYDKHSLLFWESIVAILILIPLLFVQPADYTRGNLLIVLGLSIINISGVILLYKGIQNSQVQKAAILSLIGLILAPVAGYVFFQEMPTLQIFLGGILLIIAVYLSTLSSVKTILHKRW